jgi:membrane protease YdiL (CAAX protease family)
LLTAALFAGVHPLWTVPPIFCLAVCLGFAYERTGNLWVPVVMHSTFNGLMTAYFLLGVAPD